MRDAGGRDGRERRLVAAGCLTLTLIPCCGVTGRAGPCVEVGTRGQLPHHPAVARRRGASKGARAHDAASSGVFQTAAAGDRQRRRRGAGRRLGLTRPVATHSAGFFE
jgi:hypothetical protein